MKTSLKILSTVLVFLTASAGFAESRHTTLSEFTDLLEIDRTCAGVAQIDSTLQTYKQLLGQSETKPEDVNAYAQKIRSWIKDVAKRRDRCRQSVLSEYLVGSMYLLTSDLQDHGARESLPNRMPLSAGWAYYAVVALNQNLVQFTDGEVIRTNSTDHEDSLSILGSYRCDSSSILFDPAQSPLNLAGAFTHELYHLFFDRFSSLRSTASNIGLQNGRSLVLLEETFASILTGYLQREFSERVLAPQLKAVELSDLNFYSKKGPLVQVLKALNSDKNEWQDAYRYQLLIYAGFFNKGNYSWTRCQPDPVTHRYIRDCKTSYLYENKIPVETYTEQLFNKISRPYFGREMTPAEQKVLSSKDIDNAFTTNGFYSESTVGMYFAPFVEYLEWWSTATPHALRVVAAPDTPTFSSANWAVGYRINSVAQIKGIPFEIRRALSGETPRDSGMSSLCKAFHSEISSGGLKGYAGENSGHPGGDGVRPVEGIRPCLQMGDQL